MNDEQDLAGFMAANEGMIAVADAVSTGEIAGELVALEPSYGIGIHDGIPNETYHKLPGISKSGLWTIYQKTPAHYRYAERKETNAFDVGEAVHLAVLQPDEFEKRVIRGPKDRRGNNWKDFLAEANNSGRLLLTESDFDKALEVRDTVHADAWLNSMIVSSNSKVEQSGIWIDEETGVQCRVRTDLYRPDLRVIFDLKSTISAAADEFSRSVVNYGYNAQEAWYTDGWRALGQDVDAFVFIALEKETPYCRAVYELPPSIVEEGRIAMRKTLRMYAQCEALNQWPGYDTGVQELQFKRWAYTETEAPAGEEG